MLGVTDMWPLPILLLIKSSAEAFHSFVIMSFFPMSLLDNVIKIQNLELVWRTTNNSWLCYLLRGIWAWENGLLATDIMSIANITGVIQTS